MWDLCSGIKNLKQELAKQGGRRDGSISKVEHINISWFSLNTRPTPVSTSDTWMGFPLSHSWTHQEHLHHEGTYKHTVKFFSHNPEKKGYLTLGNYNASYRLPTMAKGKSSLANNGFTNFLSFLFFNEILIKNFSAHTDFPMNLQFGVEMVNQGSRN